MSKKIESRMIPEETNPKFFAQELKAYEFTRNAAKDKMILDIGCGDGYGPDYLARVASRVTGIDYEEDIILKAQRKYILPNLKFLCMEAANLDFRDNSFDIICSFQVIEHIPENNLEQYLSEIKRVLKPEGVFYLSTLNLENNIKSPLTYEKNPAHRKEFILLELRDLLSKAFAKIEIYGLHPTLKHRFYLRLKKIGIFNFLPERLNPVTRFYSKVKTSDFIVTKDNLRKAIDFICICYK